MQTCANSFTERHGKDMCTNTSVHNEYPSALNVCTLDNSTTI